MDPTSLDPEAQALKRQCVIHGKPFVATVAGALEWVAVELARAGLASQAPPQAKALFALEQQTLALIAHDARKEPMVDFANTHFDLPSRFASRVATGTTGSRLNAMAWSRGWPADRVWVTRMWRASTRRTFSCWSARCTAPPAAPLVSIPLPWPSAGHGR